MNKTAVAICMVTVMLCVAFAAVSASGQEAEGATLTTYTEYSGYEPQYDENTGTSLVHYLNGTYAGCYVNQIKSLTEGQYQDHEFPGSWKVLLINCETVPASAFEGCNATRVVLSPAVKTIEDGAFRNCTSLASVEKLGDDPVDIGSEAFSGCTALEFVDGRYIGDVAEDAFDGCSFSTVVYESSDIPDNFPYTQLVTISASIPEDEIYAALYIKSKVCVLFIGMGVLAPYTLDGEEVSAGISYSSMGMIFTLTEKDEDLVYDYKYVTVSYGGAFGLEDETFLFDCYEVDLAAPAEGVLGVEFYGWAYERVLSHTTLVYTLGTTLNCGYAAYYMRSVGAVTTIVPLMDDFTVSYDLSGLPDGETADALDDQTCNYGSAYAGSMCTESRYLAGWTVEGDESGTVYPAGGEILTYADHTAVAVWTEKRTVSYVSEGETILAEYTGDGFTVELCSDAERYGYELAGWTDGESVYEPGESVTVTCDMTLTALWDEVLYTVEYESLGALLSSTQVQEGTVVTVHSDVSWTGYTLSGWSDGSQVVEDGSSYTVGSDVSFAAVWAEAFFTVAYESEGEEVSSGEVQAGTAIEIGCDIARSGYHVSGWSDGEDLYEDGETYVVASDVTFSAVWEENAYTVAYESEGDVLLELSAYEGESIAVGCVAELYGYELAGWSDGETVYSDGDGYTVTGDVTFTAVWTEKYFTVSYASEGTLLSSFQMQEGSPLAVHSDLSRYGYVLAGWSDGESVYPDGCEYTVESDVTFTAVWTEKTYTVSYASEGTLLSEWECQEGSKITVHTDLSRYGYELSGWSYGGGELEDGSEFTVTSDVTFTAVWSAVSCTVAYVSEGEIVSSLEVAMGESVTVGADVSRDGYELTGWSDGSTVYKEGDEIAVESDVTLTAVWSGGAYTVTYVSDGQIVALLDASADGFTVHWNIEKYGYELAGWSDGESVYEDGEEYVLACDTVFTAVWAERMYTVTYYSEGEAVYAVEAQEGSSVTVGADASRTGYYLAGWTDGETAYSEGDEITVEGDVELEAVWEVWYHSVAFVSEGSVLYSAAIQDGLEVEVHWDVSRYGYVLSGWTDGESFYEDGEAWTASADATFTAVWTERTFTVTYVSDGETVGTAEVQEGTATTLGCGVSCYGYYVSGWSDGDAVYEDGSEYTVTEDVTLTAVWSVRMYTVEFVSGGETIESYEVQEGTVVSVTADASLTGYALDGWAFGGTVYGDGSEYTVECDTTFAAVWSVKTFTVSYTADGETVSTAEVQEGVTVTVHADASKTGYYASGWSDGSTTYADGSEYTVTGDVTFAAVWSVRTYTVVFVSDGTVMSSSTVQDGKTISVGCDLSRYGYELSWISDSGDAYADGDSYTVASDVTFTAAWSVKTYTVSYVSEGTVIYKTQVQEGQSTEVGCDVSRTGYALAGWSDGEAVYGDGSEYTVTEDVTLTAVWEVRMCTVVLADGDEVLSTSYVQEGKSIALSYALSAYGYELAGWSDGENVYEDGSEYTVTSDVTLTAVWEEKTYTVTYVSEGEVLYTCEAQEGSEAVVSLEASRYGYAFVCWNDGVDDVEDGSSYTVTSDVTFTAVWEEKLYTVTYVSDGEIVCSFEAQEGDTVTVGCGVSAYGYEIAGWAVGSDVLEDGSELTVAGDTTLTAVWEEKTYTVTYASEGEVLCAFEAQEGSAISVSLEAARYGYTLAGWSDGETVYEDGDLYTVTSDVAFTAVWSEKTYTVTYVSEGEVLCAFEAQEGETIEVGCEASRYGYSLSGWSVTAGVVADGSEYTVTGDVAFTAVWTEKTYTVTYVSNGEVVSTCEAQEGSDVSVGCGASEYGYELTGWSDGEDVYADGDGYTVTCDVTFTAVWTVKTYTVAYVSEGEALSSYEAQEGSAVSVGCDASRDGYVLEGWSDGSSVYAAGDEYTVTGDVTFTAVWAAETVTATFHLYGGLEIQYTVETGGTVEAPTYGGLNSGYTLAGWSLTEGGDAYCAAGEAITVTGDVDLYPVWASSSALGSDEDASDSGDGDGGDGDDASDGTEDGDGTEDSDGDGTVTGDDGTSEDGTGDEESSNSGDGEEPADESDDSVDDSTDVDSSEDGTSDDEADEDGTSDTCGDEPADESDESNGGTTDDSGTDGDDSEDGTGAESDEDGSDGSGGDEPADEGDESVDGSEDETGEESDEDGSDDVTEADAGGSSGDDDADDSGQEGADDDEPDDSGEESSEDGGDSDSGMSGLGETVILGAVVAAVACLMVAIGRRS